MLNDDEGLKEVTAAPQEDVGKERFGDVKVFPGPLKTACPEPVPAEIKTGIEQLLAVPTMHFDEVFKVKASFD